MKQHCDANTCVLCESEVPCLNWHEVTDHNMPLLFGMSPEQAQFELRTHLGGMWISVARAINGHDLDVLHGTNDRDLRGLARAEFEELV